MKRWLARLELHAAVLAAAAGLWLWQHGHHKTAATAPAAPVALIGARIALQKLARKTAAVVVAETETLILETVNVNTEIAQAVANVIEKIVATHFPQLAALQPELNNAVAAVATLAEKAAVTYGSGLVGKLLASAGVK